MMLPNEISILLSIHVCGKPDRGLVPVISPAIHEAVLMFLEQDLVEFTDRKATMVASEFALMPRGKVYVEYLQHIPLPREKTLWVIDQLPFPPEI